MDRGVSGFWGSAGPTVRASGSCLLLVWGPQTSYELTIAKKLLSSHLHLLSKATPLSPHLHSHSHSHTLSSIHVNTLRHGCKFCSPLCACTAGSGDSNSSQSACASIVYEFSNTARPALLASTALGLPEAQTTILTQRMFPSSMTNMPWCLVCSESATRKCQSPHEAVKLFRKPLWLPEKMAAQGRQLPPET